MKRQLSDLARFGATPAFKDPLHVGRPFIGDRRALLSRLEGALDRRWLTNDGPLLVEFEAALEARLDAEFVIPLANGTMGLMVLAKALGLSGEVIMPSYTFVATAHAFEWLGIKPVFCEVDPGTHNIDVQEIERLITPATSAVLGVHLWGRPCDIAAIENIAASNGIAAIFDAAHAFDVASNGKKIGNFGIAEVFSFHATKFVNALEGGAIATNDKHLAEQVRLMINFGFSGFDQVDQLGINGKMNEFSAAMGLSTFAEIDDIKLVNKCSHEAYASELTTIAGLNLLSYDDVEDANYQYLVVEVDEAEFGLSRDALVELLQAERILARRYFHPGCHHCAPYRDEEIELPITDSLSERVLCLPIGAEISPGKIGIVGSILDFLQRNSNAIGERLCGLSGSARKAVK